MSSKHSNSSLQALWAGLSLALITTLCLILVGTIQSRSELLQKEQLDSKTSRYITSLLPPEAQGEEVAFQCKLINDKKLGRKMPLYIALKQEQIVGYLLSYQTNMGYSNPLILIAGFDANKQIYKVDIQVSNETPGLGDKVDRQHGTFLDALSGKGSGVRYDVKKYGGDFDYITGSTVTSRAVIVSTGEALSFLMNTDLDKLANCGRR
ncbi:MAG: FMN-binding protein [Succinivibrio sp.]|nr:FMN-binding protein [Succinivibrio sp.]